MSVFEDQEHVAARAEAQRCDGTAANRRRLFRDRAVARHDWVETTQAYLHAHLALRKSPWRSSSRTSAASEPLPAERLSRIPGQGRGGRAVPSSISASINAFSRFPQIRSDASQRSTSALCSACRPDVAPAGLGVHHPGLEVVASHACAGIQRCRRTRPYPRLLRAIRTPIARACRRCQFFPRCHA
ncbi:hypothetical protein ABIA45_007410 [Bradyrhizobium sp. USDA 336]